jgi:hypothetical protein
MAIAPIVANGVPVSSQISTPDTFNLHSINLTAGERYVFIAQGATEGKGTLADPNIKIGNFDASGNFVPIVSSKGGLSIGSIVLDASDPLISFVPPTTGTYGVAVGSDIPHGTGTYTLEVAPSGSLIGGPLIGTLPTTLSIIPTIHTVSIGPVSIGL